MRLTLQTARGRAATFFALYITQGIPLGFTAVALATEMRRRGLGLEQTAALVSVFYLPWTWKGALGPFVDVLGHARLGRRRGWILGAQAMMVATLTAALNLDPVTQVASLTALVFLHNAFAAIQDVAIDALACDVLPAHERGTANGLMVAGAIIGQAIGGPGMLYLREPLRTALGSYGALQVRFLLVAACILVVTLLVVVPLREASPEQPENDAPPLLALGGRARSFLLETWRTFSGSRAARAAMLFGLLPMGATGLSLGLSGSLAIDSGMGDQEIGSLTLWSTMLMMASCVIGGKLSDYAGRRQTLALYVALTAVPTVYLAWKLREIGWAIPGSGGGPAPPHTAAQLRSLLWIAGLTYAVPQGLAYGTRAALFMDLTNRSVAATQLALYLTLPNIAYTLCIRWQGWAVARWGYSATLALDAFSGMLALAFLPWMKPERSISQVPPEPAGTSCAAVVARAVEHGPNTVPPPA